ncbi:MAG: SulP family inorganic anion transporter, partial [Fusobacteriaceae bacterium]
IGQSMINITSGGRGRISGVAMALSILTFVLLGSKVIEIIPLAALVGVMFIVVIETFAWDSLKLLKRIPKKDSSVIVIVALVTVFVDLAAAVVLGIILSALIFAWEKGKRICVHTKEENGIKYYILDGPLFFASVSCFKELFDVKNDPKEIVIDFKNSSVRDHSAIEALNSLTEKYRQSDKILHLRHLSSDCRILLNNAKDILEVNIQEDPKYHIADDIID